MKEIILASVSPRRKELLKNLGLGFKAISSDVHENTDEELSPAEFVKKFALLKAKDVFHKHQNSIVIGADTIVVCDNNILGKPKDEEDAFKMLNMLSGEYHEVYTGLAVVAQGKEVCEAVRTVVRFKELSIEEMEKYIKTGEPMDKAGGYGIQGKGALFVESIGGDYNNVVGLPVNRLYNILKKQFEVDILE